MAPSIHSPSSSSSSELPPNLCSNRQSRRFSEPTDVMRMMEKAKEEQNKKKKKEVPKQKGEWLPAAIFIFLSHILVGLYSIGFIKYHLFTRSSSSPSSADIDDFSYYRVSGWMVALTLFSAWLNLLGITAGYHRLWSHNSYKATTSLRIFLAIIGLCSFQGSARWWVLKHRLHHRFTDTDCDPYDARKGLWYSHIGWLFEAPPYISKVHLISMKDVDTDPVAAFQKRHLLIGYVLFGLILPGMIGMWCDGSFIIGAIWIGFIGRFISWHCIWTINSLSHWHGYREFSRASSAVYVMLVNLIQNGEGHHNYHHNFPLDYRHGHRWYEWDPTKWLINVWYYFGLAYDLQTIPDEQITLAQSMVKHEEADELSQRVRNLPIDESKLPIVTEAEFEAMASKLKGAKVILRWGCFVLDVSEFVDSGSHPGGSSYLKAYHGRDMTDAFEGEINLHTQAAHNWAKQMRIARISQ